MYLHIVSTVSSVIEVPQLGSAQAEKFQLKLISNKCHKLMNMYVSNSRNSINYDWLMTASQYMITNGGLYRDFHG